MQNEKLDLMLQKAIKNAGYEEENAKVIKSKRPELCDCQFDGVFKLASKNSISPKEIGENIAKNLIELNKNLNYYESIEFVLPGFINLKLSEEFINEEIVAMNDNDKFNFNIPEKVETFVLDYGGPNIAKPLHVGHLRTAIIGESIKRIINFCGHKTIADVHLGDYGLQIGQVIYGLIEKNIKPEDITLKDLNEIYPKYSKLCKEDEDLKETCAKITKSIQDGEERYIKYYNKISEISINDIKQIYNYLGVSFDYWYGEKDAEKYIKNVENILNEKNLLVKSNEALVVDVKEDEDKLEIPPLIFKKSNGAYLYGSTDLATIYQREKDFKPDHILYCTDLRQSLHFKQVFRVANKANLTKATLEHLGYGTINGNDNKPYKTRSGETPKLVDLFNEIEDTFENIKEENKLMSKDDKIKIVNSIIKFADFQNYYEKDYIFDINKFSKVVGKTGPYILYTYLRINKILLNENTNNLKLSKTIYNQVDKDLKLKLLELHSAINNAFINRLPTHIAMYLYELCAILNIFYQTNHIVTEKDINKKEDWLYILNLANKVIKEMLNLLIIDIPSKM